MTTPITTPITPKVFISYAHADGQTAVKNFWKHLKNYLNSEKYTWEKWDDTQIAVGEKWDDIIHNALSNQCNCCLLLISDLFGKSSYIRHKEWPMTLQGFEEKGIIFFPIVFGVLESDFDALPEQLNPFQIYYPSITDLYKIPPKHVTHPDDTYLCYKELDNAAVKDRFVSKLAYQMDQRFDQYIEIEMAKKKALASHTKSQVAQVDLSLFVSNADPEDTLAHVMFGSFSFEKRYRDSKSKQHYFRRNIDVRLDESLQNKDWLLIEGHPLAGKTRAAFEAIKRLISNTGHSFALWSFSLPESAQTTLTIPLFPPADYQIVWMDDFDALLRDLSKRGYSASDINLFLKQLADRQLILIATARTGPQYADLRHRFGLNDHLWDKLETFLIERLSGTEQRKFAYWYQETFSETLSRQFDHNPGSLFLDLKAMRDRWRNISIRVNKSNPKINAEHLRELLKALHVFYVMEAYRAGGRFLEKDIQSYLVRRREYQQNETSIGIAFAQLGNHLSHPFKGNLWEELIEILSQDRFNLGFLRREGSYLVTETAYLDYIIAPDGEKNIAYILNTAFPIEMQQELGISITNYNFSDVFSKQAPRNKKQLMQLIRKLKPLGFEQNISVWNQLISLCPSQKLANIAIAMAREKGLRPNQITYLIFTQKTFSTEALLIIIKEIKADQIPIDDRFYSNLINRTQDFQSAKLLIKALDHTPNVSIYNSLLQKVPDYLTAQTVLKEMKQKGVNPTSSTYNRVLQKAPDYSTAQAVLQEMKQEGVNPNSGTYDHVLQKVSDYSTAQAVLQEMKQEGVNLTSSTYSYVLQNTPDYSTAQTVLKEMKQEGVNPNCSTYDHLLQKVPDYLTAQTVLKEMKQEGVNPNCGTYNCLLVKAPDYSTAQAVLKEMKQEGVNPNSAIYGCLLEKAPDYSTAQAVLKEMKQEGVNPNCSTYDHLLQKVPDYLTAQTVLKEMKQKEVNLTSGIYDRLIQKAPDYSTAQAVLKEMKQEGWNPTVNTYNLFFSKISSYQELKNEITKLRLLGFSFKEVDYFYYHLIRTADNYELGRNIFNEMLNKNIKPHIGIFNQLIKKSPNKTIALGLMEEISKFLLIPNENSYKFLDEKIASNSTRHTCKASDINYE